MSTVIGKTGEQLVAEELKKRQHRIIALNWRTRRCEIDIVSMRKNTVYFTEVKTRSQNIWGSGLDYISKTKLKQMCFAVEMWVHDNNWPGDVRLLAAEVSPGQPVTLIELET